MIPLQLDRFASLFSEGFERTPPTLAERRRRRGALLREHAAPQVRRIVGALGGLAKPGGLVGLFNAANLLMRDALVGRCGLPVGRCALESPEGLCGLARKPTASEALEAYASGLVLHAPLGPVCWWSPAQRWALTPGQVSFEDEALAGLHRLGAEIEMDGDFDSVLVACSRAEPCAGRAGFGAGLMRIYSELADAGLVHAVAVRAADGTLLAGALGLAIGRIFVTEAVFGPKDLMRDVLCILDRELAARNFALHEARLGGRPGAPPAAPFQSLPFSPVSRAQFVAAANRNLSGFYVQRWRPRACGGSGLRRARGVAYGALS